MLFTYPHSFHLRSLLVSTPGSLPLPFFMHIFALSVFRFLFSTPCCPIQAFHSLARPRTSHSRSLLPAHSPDPSATCLNSTHYAVTTQLFRMAFEIFKLQSKSISFVSLSNAIAAYGVVVAHSSTCSALYVQLSAYLLLFYRITMCVWKGECIGDTISTENEKARENERTQPNQTSTGKTSIQISESFQLLLL